MPGVAAPYLVRRSAVDLSNPRAVTKFIAEMSAMADQRGEGVVLIILDTFVLSLGDLDENSSSDITVATEAAKRIAGAIQAHVCLVHHSGKDSDKGARGSSSLRAAVDTEIELVPAKEDGVVTAKTRKQRTLPKAADVHFRIAAHLLGQDEDGAPRTTAKAVAAKPPDVGQGPNQKSPQWDRQTAVVTVLHAMRQSGRTSVTTAEVLGSMPPETVQGVNSEDGRKKAVSRVLEKMAGDNDPRIGRSANGWTLKRDAHG